MLWEINMRCLSDNKQIQNQQQKSQPEKDEMAAQKMQKDLGNLISRYTQKTSLAFVFAVVFTLASLNAYQNSCKIPVHM